MAAEGAVTGRRRGDAADEGGRGCARVSTSDAVDAAGPAKRGRECDAARATCGDEGALGEKEGNEISDLLSSPDATLEPDTDAGTEVPAGMRLLARLLSLRPLVRIDRDRRELRVDEAADCCETERERGAVMDDVAEARRGAAVGATGVVVGAVGDALWEAWEVWEVVIVVEVVIEAVVEAEDRDGVTARADGESMASSRSMVDGQSWGGMAQLSALAKSWMVAMWWTRGEVVCRGCWWR